MTYYLTSPYTPSYFYDELRGISDGSGVSYMRVVRMHMIPELIKARCTMVGAWGKAIQDTNGTLYQLRALDWVTNGPFQQYPTAIVYHPNTGNGHPFAIFGWAGFIGTVTGFSSSPLGLCEKVWLGYNESDSRSGIPFHFLLRDILQYDDEIDSAVNRIFAAQRTCSIWIGLGDYSNQFRSMQYSLDEVRIYDDRNFPEYKGHPRLPGAVYVDKHVQPSSDPCLGSLMESHYGQLDAVTIKEHISAEHATGDSQVAIYDYAHMFVYLAYASPYENNQFTPAYNRAFVRLDMSSLFSTTP